MYICVCAVYRNLFDLAVQDWDLELQPRIMHNFNLRGRKLVDREASLESKANVIVRFLSVVDASSLEHTRIRSNLIVKRSLLQVQQEGQRPLTGQRAANLRRDLGATYDFN